MANIKCIVNYPDNFISEIGPFSINLFEANREITGVGILTVTKNGVNVGAGLNIEGILFGTRNATCTMDVFIDGSKYNSTPIESEYIPERSGQIFNWTS